MSGQSGPAGPGSAGARVTGAGLKGVEPDEHEAEHERAEGILHRRRRMPVGRRGQGQGRRRARGRCGRGGALPGWGERGAHRPPRRPRVHSAPGALGNPAPREAMSARERRRGGPGAVLRRDRSTGRAGRRPGRPRGGEHPRPRRLPLSHGARQRCRGGRRAKDRNHGAGHRSRLRSEDRTARGPHRRPARPAPGREEGGGGHRVGARETDRAGSRSGSCRHCGRGHERGQPRSRRWPPMWGTRSPAPSLPGSGCCSRAPRARPWM